MMLDNNDILSLNKKGINQDLIIQQLNNFKNGFPYINLHAAATLDNGIKKLSEEELERYLSYYERNEAVDKLKFVPASGAATRMFKVLHEAKNLLCQNTDIEEVFHKYPEFKSFVNEIHRFAFYADLNNLLLTKGSSVDKIIAQNNYIELIDSLLFENGLNYANLPKALIKFHQDEQLVKKAMDEHLIEAVFYANNNSVARIHFTLSPEHIDMFVNHFNDIKKIYENRYHVKYDVSYSIQKHSTDTVSVDMNNQLLRDENNELIFRPSGHGALIENLNDLDSDIIFIKNIDNVVVDRLKPLLFNYKKALAGYLLSLQEVVFGYLNNLFISSFDDIIIEDMVDFVQNVLNIPLIEGWNEYEDIEKVDWLYETLNRPIRICGMVKNEGEPGGGPFWVEKYGEISLQIVESAQINMNNAEQKKIFDSSTHFNPVDIICGIKDFNGNKFDLKEFVDAETGFISIKSRNGENIKVQELPGLWNGSMANWITLFVEVPIETFNPVKVVNDLLRENHQS